jgi:hypothetical protein
VGATRAALLRNCDGSSTTAANRALSPHPSPTAVVAAIEEFIDGRHDAKSNAIQLN